MLGLGHAFEVRAAGVGPMPCALSLAAQSSSLAAEDLELLATAAYLLIGKSCGGQPVLAWTDQMMSRSGW